MTHRVEQIMVAVQAAVTGLTTTGSRVDRGRGDDIPAESTPALRVAMGDDRSVEPWSQSVLDSEVAVSVSAHVYDAAVNVETTLNKIRSEVTVALMANNQNLGLAFVLAIVELGAGQPEMTPDMAKPAGRMEMQFRVRYRRSVGNPDA